MLGLRVLPNLEPLGRRSIVIRDEVVTLPPFVQSPEESWMVLTEAQQKEFEELGFVRLRGFYSPEQAEQLSKWLDAIHNLDPKTGEEAKYYEAGETSGEPILVRVENILHEGNPVLRDLVLNQKMRQVLEDVLGEPAVLFKDKANYKLPGCRSDLLHQDQAAGWGIYADFFVTAVVAVDRNRRENAPISIMRSGNYERALMTDEWRPLSNDEPPFQPEDEYVEFLAEPGDVLLFDCFVPHGSPANTSRLTRRNLYLTFNGASKGDHRADYYADKWANYPPNTADEARPRASFRV